MSFRYNRVRTYCRKWSLLISCPVACVTSGGGCAGSDPWVREVREAGRQGGEDGMTMQIPVAHEHQKESSNSLLFSNPSRGTSKQTADIDAHIEVPSTPSTMERIMSQPSSSPDCLRLFPPVASCEPQGPQAKNRWRWRSSFPIWAVVEEYLTRSPNLSSFLQCRAGLSRPI